LIRKLEQGRRNTASIAGLHRIARALDTDLGELLGRQAMPESASHAGVVALRLAVADVDDLLGDVQGDPLSLHDADRSVTYLWGTYWSGKYETLTSLIPQALTELRSTLHSAGATERARAAEYLARGYWVAGSTLAQLQQPDAAFMAVRRAVDLAMQSDDPMLVATLKGSMAWQLMVGGRSPATCWSGRESAFHPVAQSRPTDRREPHLTVQSIGRRILPSKGRPWLRRARRARPALAVPLRDPRTRRRIGARGDRVRQGRAVQSLAGGRSRARRRGP